MQQRVFTRVPDGLPEDYPAEPAKTGLEQSHHREVRRQIFNSLYGLADYRQTLFQVNKFGLAHQSEGGVILLQGNEGNLGFMVISLFPQINNLGPDHQGLERVDVGAIFDRSRNDLSLISDPDLPEDSFLLWKFLYDVANRFNQTGL
jgi:hypothetical protein